MGLVFLIGYMGCGKSTLGRPAGPAPEGPVRRYHRGVEDGRDTVSTSSATRVNGAWEIERECSTPQIAEYPSAVISTGRTARLGRQHGADECRMGHTVYRRKFGGEHRQPPEPLRTPETPPAAGV